MSTRKPAVAGQFYPGSKKEITKLYESVLLSEKAKINYSLAEEKIIGGIVPHAGFMFSGYEAIHFFEIVNNSSAQYETIFIINPNHTGYGTSIALDENEYWETPMGKLEIDEDFMRELPFSQDEMAHRYEHSGEIMVPFLQYLFDYEFRILPVTLSGQTHDNAKILARSIYETNEKLNKKILIIASSDFSHHLRPEVGQKLDKHVIDAILDKNAQKVEQEVRSKNITVCGYGPIMTLIEYSKLISDNYKIKLLRKGHSGDVMPSDSVVDYACFLFYE